MQNRVINIHPDTILFQSQLKYHQKFQFVTGINAKWSACSNGGRARPQHVREQVRVSWRHEVSRFDAGVVWRHVLSWRHERACLRRQGCIGSEKQVFNDLFCFYAKKTHSARCYMILAKLSKLFSQKLSFCNNLLLYVRFTFIIDR